MITNAMKERVNAKLRECIAIANRKYNVDIQFPTVVYEKRGRVAGTANYGTWTIDLNPVLLSENFEAMLADTVPHEMAHLITDTVYPHAHQRGLGQKRSPHGAEWKSVMRALGCEPTRCHSYDTTNAAVRTKASYEYTCNCCGVSLKLGPKRHAREQRTPGFYSHSKCGRTAGKLTLVGKQAPATVHTKPKSTSAPAPKAPGGESKLAKCYGVFKSHPTLARSSMITHFIHLGCTPAGAATYYASCKKMYNEGK